MPRPDLSLISEERLLQAVEAAQRAVVDAPESAEAWGQLGHLYLVHGWEVEAAGRYRRAAAFERDDFRWRYLLGRSLENTDLVAASEALERAIDLDATYPPAHHVRAIVLRKLGRPDEARRHLERTAKLEPRNPSGQLGLGEIALSAKRFEEARDHLLRALEMNPGQSEAHQALAQVFLALGDRAAAERHASAGRKPTRPMPLQDPLWDEVEQAGVTKYWFSKRANRYLAAKDYERATVEFAQAASDDERNPMFWYNYANALLRSERYAEAVPIYERAVAALQDPYYKDRLEPERKVKIFINLGLAYANAGALDSSERSFQEALAVDPSSFETIYNLVVLYSGQRRLEDAIRLLQGSQATATDARLRQMLDRLVLEHSASPKRP